MSESGSPPLWGVLAYLTNIIISIGMIWYLINFFLSCSSCTAKPLTFVFFIAFLAIIGISSFRLFGMLFPERKKSCPACSLITRIIEIDLKVRWNQDNNTNRPVIKKHIRLKEDHDFPWACLIDGNYGRLLLFVKGISSRIAPPSKVVMISGHYPAGWSSSQG